jgi:hypothetical protein
MKRLFSILLGGLLLSATFTAWAAGDRTAAPPIISWQPPTTFTPPHAAGRTALTDISGPLPLVPMVPCRQYSSLGTPLLQATPRAVTVTGAPCGVLSNSFAIAVNITVFNIVATSNAVFKVGTASPPTTAFINYPPTEIQRGNAGVIATNGTSIFVEVDQGSGQVDFVVDIYGYYPLQDSGHVLNPGEYFEIATTIAPPFASINARNNSTAAGAIALQGIAGGASGDTIAIFGTNGSSGFGSLGVYGSAFNGIGAYGLSTNNIGVQAFSTTYDALYAVGGRNGSNSNGTVFGAIGHTSSTAANMAGVLGTDGAGGGSASSFSAGVRGEGKFGVWGISDTTSGCGVCGTANAPTVWGVFAFGEIGATGTKPFVEPHPTDPTLTIRYVALEGPEPGTYFRGTAKTVNGEAVIQVPDTFRIVTDEEGLTVQLTPVGEFVQLAVMSEDLNQIVVRSSRDVTFHYHVNGIRRAFKNWQVVKEGSEFRPVSADQKAPRWLSEDAKSRLISNGTYNPDGTVNMATAERLGWAKAWREEAAAAAAARK